jgi:hypothetical protein
MRAYSTLNIALSSLLKVDLHRHCISNQESSVFVQTTNLAVIEPIICDNPCCTCYTSIFYVPLSREKFLCFLPMRDATEVHVVHM